jgi:pSer/pThr/pTyr-binding forkhead associated (FHA) protein
MPLLKVIDGPDSGRTAKVEHHAVTIGRGPGCGLRLTDGQASMIHAVVEPFKGSYRVRDLETAGGTAVNGTQTVEQRLVIGDTIGVGDTTILFGSGGERVGGETVGSAESPSPGDSTLE